MKILIKNARVWDGENFYFSDVLTRDEKVEKIASNLLEEADFVYDAKGKIVSSGLVDSHIHMEGVSSEYYSINPELSCVPFGVTCACDAGGMYGDKNFLNSFLIKNTVLAIVEIIDSKANFSNTEKLLEAYGEKAIGVKVCLDNSGGNVKDITPLKDAVDFCQKRNLKVMVHTTGSPVEMKKISEVLKKGDILSHPYHGGENNSMEDGFESLFEAKEKGVFIDSALAGNVHTDFSVLKYAIEKGALPHTISSDITCRSAYMRGGRYGLTMCMSIMKTLGMKEEDIMRAVTTGPAKALGKDNEWGRLEVGRCADIAVLDYTDEPFDLTDRAGNRVTDKMGYRCKLTIVNGKVVYRD